MARPSNKQERRRQIALGLKKVMAAKGYEGASIAEIAAAAELTPGLVHYHFKNKQEILLELLQVLVSQHNDTLEARLSAHAGHPLDQLEAFVDFHLGIGADANPETVACWLVISGEALRQPEVQAAFEVAISGYTDRLATIIKEGLDKSLFQCHAPAAAASALIATIQGYFVLSATARNQIPRGTAASCTKKMARGLLSPAQPFPGG